MKNAASVQVAFGRPLTPTPFRLYQLNDEYSSGSLPISRPAMFCLPIPFTSALASVVASLTLSASRLTPRISREFSAVFIAWAICSHVGVSV